jgi:glycosyltransferase involved in cell wall biosynthesis
VGDAGATDPGPVLSVCMPTYGRPMLLERALESVVQVPSTHASRIEIVVADNSPELNGGIVERFLGSWPGPTRYLTNETNIGAVPNFNRAGFGAAGRYLVFLHDDDRLLPGALDEIVGVVSDRQGGVAVYLFGVDVVDESGRVRRRQTFAARRTLSPSASLKRLLSDSSFVRMPGMVVNRELFTEIGGFDVSVGNPTDFELLIRVFATHGVTCVPALTAQYTVHRDAATSGMFNADTIATLMKLFDRAEATRLLDERLVRRSKRDFFHQFILGGAYRAMRNGDLQAARDVLSLFRLRDVRALGPSPRWSPVRATFTLFAKLPDAIAEPLLRGIGRLSIERLWHP